MNGNLAVVIIFSMFFLTLAAQNIAEDYAKIKMAEAISKSNDPVETACAIKMAQETSIKSTIVCK